MDSPTHRMIAVQVDGDATEFDCTVHGCGRRIRIDRRTARVVVLQQGVVDARHFGSSGPVMLVGGTASQ